MIDKIGKTGSRTLDVAKIKKWWRKANHLQSEWQGLRGIWEPWVDAQAAHRSRDTGSITPRKKGEASWCERVDSGRT